MKKLDLRLRNAGEGGIFWRVSMARSDSEGRDFRGASPALLASNPSSTVSLSDPFCVANGTSS